MYEGVDPTTKIVFLLIFFSSSFKFILPSLSQSTSLNLILKYLQAYSRIPIKLTKKFEGDLEGKINAELKNGQSRALDLKRNMQSVEGDDSLAEIQKTSSIIEPVFIQGLKHQAKMIPDFKLLGYKLELIDTLDELSMKMYTQFVMKLYLERPIGFFIWEVYLPASFIVLMSFTSFWLDRNATPARVSLGVTTVLTMTTLLSSANKNLPHTAYPKV